MKRSPYRFPKNKRAADAFIWAQLEKVVEEAEEAYLAHHYLEGDARIIEETWDVIVAAEGVLRKFKLRDVLIGMARVRIKNKQRGDW